MKSNSERIMYRVKPYLWGHDGSPFMSTSFMYIRGGRMKVHIVTVEPPMRLAIVPMSGTARANMASAITIADRSRIRGNPNSENIIH